MKQQAPPSTEPEGEPAQTGAREMTTCFSCEASNPSEHRFCRECGALLWVSCPQCDEERPVDERFCGSCGEDMQAAQRQLVADARARLDEIRKIVDHLELGDALLALEHLIAEQTHPCLETIRQEAVTLREQVARQRQLHIDQAARLTETARCLLEQHKYESAIAELERIPPPMRDNGALDLLEGARAAANEISALKTMIRQPTGVPFLERMRAIERLLDLQPNDPQGLGWAQRARDQILQVANQKLQTHQYSKAVELLRSIPSSVVDQSVTKSLQRAVELEYLASEMELAAEVVDDTLQMARRLVQLDPDNADAKRTLAEMTRRHQEARSAKGIRFAEWTPCPASPRVGLPVHHAAAPQRMLFQSTDSQRLFREHPGEFFVACGLALQALQRVVVTSNLVPAREEGLLSKIRLASLKRPARSAWGLDVGINGLKAVRLELDDADQIMIRQCHYVAHRKPLTHPEVAAVKPAIVRDTLKSLSAQVEFSESDRVATQWPLVQSLVRFPQLPHVEGKKRAGVLANEARLQIPFPLDEVCWDAFTFGNSLAAVAGSLRTTMLLAARKRDVEEHLALFREAGIEIQVLQCDAVALHNFHHYDRLTAGTGAAHDPAEGVVLLDVGTIVSRVVYSFPDMLWFRSIPVGREEMIQGLAQRFKLTREVADQVLRNPTRAKRISDVHQACCSVYQKIVGHFDSSLSEFAKNAPGRVLREMLVVGDAGWAPGLLRYLRYGR